MTSPVAGASPTDSPSRGPDMVTRTLSIRIETDVAAEDDAHLSAVAERVVAAARAAVEDSPDVCRIIHAAAVRRTRHP